jgi:ribosomal-protein-serine acetyltransferase
MLNVRLNSVIEMRLFERHDAAALFELVESERGGFQKWIPFVSKTKTLEDAARQIENFLEMHKNGSGYVYGLWDADKLIGNVLIKDIDRVVGQAAIGYMIAAAYRRQGLVLAACSHLVEYLFSELGFQKIVLCCDDRNEASIGIARRLGFELEGVLKRNVVINGELCNTMHWARFSS